MKIYNTIGLVSILLILIFTSCNDDFLDKLPKDSLNEAVIWTDQSLAENVLKGLYFEGLMNTYTRPNQFAECLEVDTWTDNGVNRTNNETCSEAFSPSNGFGDWASLGNYTKQYENIRKACLIIDELQKDNTFDDDQLKKQFIAEARCMRAMIYGWMARRWGGLMLVDETLSPEDDLNLPRASESDTYDFIINDLKSALPDLTSKGPKERFTKGAALTLLLRIAVEGRKWDDAIAAGDQLLYGKEGDWQLDANYNQMFGNYEYPAQSPEIMFYLTFGPNKRVADDLLGMHIGSPTPPGRNIKGPQFVLNTDAWCQFHPSQELVNDYLVIDAEDGLAKKYNKTSQWLAAGEDTTSSLMYAPTRDARFDQTIVHDSAYYFTNFIVTNREGNVHWNNVQDHPWMTKSGYIWRKWVQEDENNMPIYQQLHKFTYVLLRLGEAYLNYAESQANKGNIPAAVKAMNMTRTAHGQLPALSEGISADEFWKWYKIERRVELVMEGDRYWSLIRWARVEGASGIPELNRRTHAIDINGGLTDFDGDNIPEKAGVYRFVDNHGFGTDYIFSWPKRMYFPIPQSEVINNPNILENNPGW